MDFRKSKRTEHTALSIHGKEVERVGSFKFLGVHISADLTWTTHISNQVGKAQQRLHFLRKLKHAHLRPHLLTNFYRSVMESILTYCCTVWFSSCSAENCKSIQRVVKAAEQVIGPLSQIYILTGSRRQPAKLLRTHLTRGISYSHPCPQAKDTGPWGENKQVSQHFYPQAVKAIAPRSDCGVFDICAT